MNDSIAVHDQGDVAAAQALLEATRAAEHPSCLLCGGQNDAGFKLDFRVTRAGSVKAVFDCRPELQSYSQMLHGGITSALIDAAMTNCLFSLGIVAVTAELTIRYLSPVRLDRQVEICATLESHDAPLYLLVAEMKQEGYVVARGKAKFFKVS